MAILSENGNKYEVRIVRHPENTYFDEYVKVGDREVPEQMKCERYMVTEPKTTYKVELTLKEGFKFGDFEKVVVALDVPGTMDYLCTAAIFRPTNYTSDGIDKDMKVYLEYADVEVGGQKMLGARFHFRELQIAESLRNETDVMGINPKDLGHFEVVVYKSKQLAAQLSKAEFNVKIKNWKRNQLDSGPNGSTGLKEKSKSNLWDAKKIDEDNFTKHGITSAIGFIGGRLELEVAMPIYPKSKPRPTRTQYKYVYGSRLNFLFHYRTSAYMEQVNIVKYPPPLYLYGWKELNDSERKKALKELQEINREHVHKAFQAKTGKVRPLPSKNYKFKPSDPPEWRRWEMMYLHEQKSAFEKLKQDNRNYDLGIDPFARVNKKLEIISLDDDVFSGQDVKSKIKQEERVVNIGNESIVVPNNGVSKRVRGSMSPALAETEVKNEPLDLEAPPPKRARIETTFSPSPSSLNDSQLQEKRKQAEELAKEILEAERLAELRRKQKKLQAEIEAAESGHQL